MKQNQGIWDDNRQCVDISHWLKRTLSRQTSLKKALEENRVGVLLLSTDRMSPICYGRSMKWKSYFLFLILAGCVSSQKAAEKLSVRKTEASLFENIGRALISECKSKPILTTDGARLELRETSRLVMMRGQSIASPYETIRLPAHATEIFIQTPTGIETASSQWNAVFPEVYEVLADTTLQPLPVTYGLVDSGLRRQLISKIKLAHEADSICLVVAAKIQSSEKPVAIFSFGEGLAMAPAEFYNGGPRKAIYAYPFGELIFSSKVSGHAFWEKKQFSGQLIVFDSSKHLP